MSRAAERGARCSRCDEVVGTMVTEGGRATIRLSTTSHGDELPISCPNVAFPPASAQFASAPKSDRVARTRTRYPRSER